MAFLGFLSAEIEMKSMKSVIVIEIDLTQSARVMPRRSLSASALTSL